jgi:hypothetical protein
MRYSNRFFLYAPFVLLLGLSGIVMLHWWHASDAFARHLDALNGHNVAPGITLKFSSRTIGGFPFRVDVVMENVEFDVATSHGPLTWRSEHFAMHALTYGRSQQLFEAAGRQALSWIGAEGVPHRFAFEPGSLRASAISLDGRLARFDLDMVGIDAPELSGARVQFHLRKAPDADAIDIAISADGLRLAPELRAGFGDGIRRLEMEARMTQATVLFPLLRGASEWRDAAEHWRAHAGVLNIEKLEIQWGKVSANAAGQIWLDAAHRYAGFLNLDMDHVPVASDMDSPDARLAGALSRLAAELPHSADGALRAKLAFANGQAALDHNNAPIPAGALDPLY